MFHPPILKNISRELVAVTIIYSDGSSATLDLVIGQTVRHRKSQKKIDKIVINKRGQLTEYDRQSLQTLTKYDGYPSDGVILLEDSGLEIITVAEAEKRGLL